MGDRVRIGELLAAVGTIGLALTLGLLDWFEGIIVPKDGTSGFLQVPPKGFDAGILGWFAFAALIVAILAGIVHLLRVLTGRGPERAMLQGPIAYVFAGFAFLVLLVRLFVFQPGVSVDNVSGDALLDRAQIAAYTADLSLSTGAYLGLLFTFLMVVGTWFSLHDERTGSAAAKRQTEALLRDARPIRVPHVAAPAEPEASVVADDAVGTDPSSPTSPASGGPA